MNPHKTIKSLFEPTGEPVTPKMASCKVLKTMGRFVKQFPIGQDQENLKTGFSKKVKGGGGVIFKKIKCVRSCLTWKY